MEPDFSGYVTKAGLKCSDGLTIMPDAFKHQDKATVPLVWQHGHNDPKNVLGHVELENRKDGVYGRAFFNDSDEAVHMKKAVDHKDIRWLSIWANKLLKKGSELWHGTIREVSLVLAGANPGALIDYPIIRHADGSEDDSYEDIIITTGDDIEVVHADDNADNNSDDSRTLIDILEGMTEEQMNVVAHMLTKALHFDPEKAKDEPPVAEHGDADKTDDTDEKGDKEVTIQHNVFDQTDKDEKEGEKVEPYFLKPEEVQEIIHDAMRCGSMKEAADRFVVSHGIENLESLFPEAKNLDNTPQIIDRQQAWVTKVLNGVHKLPYARFKSRFADITFEEARAKGYIKGNMKKDEYFSLSQRETGPQTVYKKQTLDRDDIIDITDFDIVVWLKAEMRVKLLEEIAGAYLVSDGREVDDEDKVKEDKIRPIASDDPFFTITVTVEDWTNDAELEAIHDAILLAREDYRGAGNPMLFTTWRFLARSLLVRDQQGRKIYPSKAELASTLMVDDIVDVPVFDRDPTLLALLVNLGDYDTGTDKGGEVNFFDDFDIDFNKNKYLLETRLSGALVKDHSAIAIRRAVGGATPVTAAAPGWDSTTHTVTIPVDANVNYINGDTGDALADGDIVLTPGQVLKVRAVPAAGKYLINTRVEWSFLRPTGS